MISICITGFLAAFLGLISLEHLLTKRKRIINDRILSLQEMGSPREQGEEKRKDSSSGFRKILTATGKVLDKRGIIKPLEEKMIQADIPLRGEEFLFFWLLAVLLPGSLLAFLTGRMPVGLLFSLIGFFLPPLLVKRAKGKKLKKFNLQLVDALSIIANSLRAGYSFMQAMELVSREMPNPIGKEFARTFREVNLGTTTEEALYNMGQRIASEDLELIITAVLIQRQIGGNLAEIMDSISDTIRDRIRIQGEIKTLTAQGRVSGMVIGFIPLVLLVFMLVINPGYITPMFHSTLGFMMLMGAVVSEIIGVLLIKKIIAIDI